ncbi:MAG: hypothetical protein ABIY56_08855 [Dokdonella sp.]
MDLHQTDLVNLLGSHPAPCLSLYQPTHRQHPDNQQDPIRFRNLVKKLHDSLLKDHAERDISALIAPLHTLAEDEDFWNHTLDGLAVFVAEGVFRVFTVQRPVAELAVVADSFHTKPLLRILQSADRYQILALSRTTARLYEANRDSVAEIKLGSEVPADSIKAREADIERERGSRTHGRVEPGMGKHGSSEVKQDGIDNASEQFFRMVDRVVRDQHSRPTGLPLLLAALPEHHNLFRKVSQNPFLITETIDSNPESMSLDDLRKAAWEKIQPRYLARLATLVDEFSAAKARDQATDDLAKAVGAARDGRVAHLLVEADRVIPGRIDADSGAVTAAALDQPDVDDLLDDLAEIVLRNRGEVIIVPTERMPSQTGLAATLRY